MTFPHMRRAMAPPTAHWHAACDHWCYATGCSRAVIEGSEARSEQSCRNCRTAEFNRAMAQQYHEDQMTVEQLLERRG